MWLAKIREAWTRCFHETRRSISPSKKAGRIGVLPSRFAEDPAPPAKARAPAAQREPGTSKSLAITARPVESEATYELVLVTGDKKGAGTSANVLVELHGVEMSSGDQALCPRPGAEAPFQRGSCSRFKIRCPPLGALRAVRWGLDLAWGLRSCLCQCF